MFDTLDAIRKDIADRLRRGASDRRSAFHCPVVATADADVRVMVLRDYDEEGRTLRFHTDARAPKVAAIGEGAPVGVAAALVCTSLPPPAPPPPPPPPPATGPK